MSDQEKLEQVDRNLTIAFRALFGAPGSERTKEQLLVLARMREISKPGRSQWTPGQDDNALAFAQGKLRLWHEIEKRVFRRPTSVHELLGISVGRNGDDDHDD